MTNLLKRTLLLVCSLLCVQITSYSQNPRIEVVPFNPFFSEIGAMVGKSVRFYEIPSHIQYGDYVYRASAIGYIRLNYNKYKLSTKIDYLVKGEVKYKELSLVELYSAGEDKSYFILSDVIKKNLDNIYDYSEYERMENYCDTYLTWRKKDILDTDVLPSDKAPRDLPYVKVRSPWVGFVKRFGKNTLAFTYYAHGKPQTIPYDLMSLFIKDFRSDDEIKQLEIEAIGKLSYYRQKYGVFIAAEMMESPRWTEEIVDKLIELIGKEDAERIVLGKLTIGMSDSLCSISWGSPDKVNRTTTIGGIDEQWVYYDKKAYLYFTNGKLTAIQEY